MSRPITLLYLEYQHDPGRQRMVMEGVIETVGGSFLADNSSKDPSRAEVERRMDMTAAIALEFYKDLKWPTTRILDELPKALRCKLDGIPYTPTRERESTWVADNARDLIWLPE